MDLDSPSSEAEVVYDTPEPEELALEDADAETVGDETVDNDALTEEDGETTEGDGDIEGEGETDYQGQGDTVVQEISTTGNPELAAAEVGIQELPATEPPEDQEDVKPRLGEQRVASRANLKASTNRKRKHGGADSAANSASGSPRSTPAPPDDSTSLAISPLFIPTTNPDFYSTRNHPMNKGGFRYLPCGPSPLSRERFPLYRLIQSPPADTVRFSWEDRSAYVNISRDGQAIMTEKGFRAARANISVREGAWYFEVTVERGAGDSSALSKGDGFGPHVRIGVGRRESHLNAPVGFDGYSYGIRDKTGDKVHLSQPRQYGSPFGTGDTIGVYIYLPPRSNPPILPDDPRHREEIRNPARIVRKRVPIRYKGQLYFEGMEYAPSKEMEDLAAMTKDPVGFAEQQAEQQQKKAAPPPGRKKAPPPPVPPPPRNLPRLANSKLAFFKNGEPQGVAYKDLFDWLPLKQHRKMGPTPRMSQQTAIMLARENHHDDGTLGYYPFVSVFGNGQARINPGPDFLYPPPDDVEALLSEDPQGGAESAPMPHQAPNGNHGSPSKGRKSKSSTGSTASTSSAPASETTRKWRPLCERYAEFYNEQKLYDSIDDRLAVESYETHLATQQATVGALPAVPSVLGDVKPVIPDAEPLLLHTATLGSFPMQPSALSSLSPPIQSAGFDAPSPTSMSSSTMHRSRSGSPKPAATPTINKHVKKKTALSNELPRPSMSASPDGHLTSGSADPLASLADHPTGTVIKAEGSDQMESMGIYRDTETQEQHVQDTVLSDGDAGSVSRAVKTEMDLD